MESRTKADFDGLIRWISGRSSDLAPVAEASNAPRYLARTGVLKESPFDAV